MCQRKEAVQVNDSNSGAKMICQQRAKNGIVPNSGVEIIYQNNSGVKIICQDNSGVKIICQCDQNMAKNGVFPNSGAKIICLETI